MAVRLEDRIPVTDILEQTPQIPETSQWALFLRNQGNPARISLSVERLLEQPDPPTREQGTDRPGRYRSSGSTPRSAFAETDWHQLAKERFAVEVAEAVNRLARERSFRHLIIIAPAKTLGELRAHLKKEASDRIWAEVTKDLTSLSFPQLAALLASWSA